VTQQPLKIRVDKWLWYARFFKTRGLAAKVVTGGHLRLNGTKVSKSSAAIVPGDILTFPQARRIRVIRVVDVGTRRGPAAEAQTLYEDLSPAEPPKETSEHPPKTPGADRKGRPTKKDRRNLDLYRS
jgi:ribosome-associated heat shock protein Hsp15